MRLMGILIMISLPTATWTGLGYLIGLSTGSLFALAIGLTVLLTVIASILVTTGNDAPPASTRAQSAATEPVTAELPRQLAA